MARISTSGPVQSIHVECKTGEDLTRNAACEALNLAGSHLQSRLTSDQGADGVLCLLVGVISWAAQESGITPARAASLALSVLRAHGRPTTAPIQWQQTKVIVEP